MNTKFTGPFPFEPKASFKTDISKLAPSYPRGGGANAKRFWGSPAQAKIDTKQRNYEQGFCTKTQQSHFLRCYNRVKQSQDYGKQFAEQLRKIALFKEE